MNKFEKILSSLFSVVFTISILVFISIIIEVISRWHLHSFSLLIIPIGSIVFGMLCGLIYFEFVAFQSGKPPKISHYFWASIIAILAFNAIYYVQYLATFITSDNQTNYTFGIYLFNKIKEEAGFSSVGMIWIKYDHDILGSILGAVLVGLYRTKSKGYKNYCSHGCGWHLKECYIPYLGGLTSYKKENALIESLFSESELKRFIEEEIESRNKNIKDLAVEDKYARVTKLNKKKDKDDTSINKLVSVIYCPSCYHGFLMLKDFAKPKAMMRFYTEYIPIGSSIIRSLLESGLIRHCK